MDVTQLVQSVALTASIYALPVLFAITLHEAAHGYVARHFGDMTAHAQGRISLNPLRHIDLVGTILVPLAFLLLPASFVFGWAKPVPVNYSALRRPKQHMAWVAAAGPAVNGAMALAWAVLLKFAGLLPLNLFSEWAEEVARAGIFVNLVFLFVNLLPILPLDGGRILASLLPGRFAWQYARLEPFGFVLLLVLLFTPMFWTSFMVPLIGASTSLIQAVVLL